MIVINNLEIQDNGQTLAVDVQTETGSTITSAMLWNMTTFKDYSRAINLDYKLEQLTNQEVFEVTAEEYRFHHLMIFGLLNFKVITYQKIIVVNF